MIECKCLHHELFEKFSEFKTLNWVVILDLIRSKPKLFYRKPKPASPREYEDNRSQKNTQSVTSMRRRHPKQYDSLDYHVKQHNSGDEKTGIRRATSNNVITRNHQVAHSQDFGTAGMPGEPSISRLARATTREDVNRQTLEQERYYQRLNNYNNKQRMIFHKHLHEHLEPTKAKENDLEALERIKREETKNRLDALDRGSRINQVALKKEYRKFLNNQMKFREQKNMYDNHMKRATLNEMKSFSQIEKEKDEQERAEKHQRQKEYREYLQSQEYLKAKKKLNNEVKLHNQQNYGIVADNVVTFGGSYLNNTNKVNKKKGYIPLNPIVAPISDPMYNPYLRNDITEGVRDMGEPNAAYMK